MSQHPAPDSHARPDPGAGTSSIANGTRSMLHGIAVTHLRSSDGATATIADHGAHLLSWCPAGGMEALYLSPTSRYGATDAIRGGVPVIFPQFGEQGPGKRHGFARVRRWDLQSASIEDGAALARLTLQGCLDHGQCVQAMQDGAGAIATMGSLAAVGVAPANQVDERGFVAPSASSSSRTPGQVTAPQLKSVAIASTTDITGATNFTATYTFDKAIGTGPVVNAKFHLYDSNGNELNGTNCAVPSTATATNAVVVCSLFADTNSPATGNTLQKDVGAATLGTVEVGAVTGSTAPNTGQNPEGAAATTGGTGTPAA